MIAATGHHTTAVKRRERASNETMLFLLFAGAVMLFAAFTASYLIRRTGADWSRVAIPSVAWGNLAVAVAGSVLVEAARKTRRPVWMLPAIALGILFLGLQAAAFRELSDAGLFASGNPHASFFSMLTGVHALHLVAGLVALSFAYARALRIGLAATWWHFVGALWLYILLMLRFL